MAKPSWSQLGDEAGAYLRRGVPPSGTSSVPSVPLATAALARLGLMPALLPLLPLLPLLRAAALWCVAVALLRWLFPYQYKFFEKNENSPWQSDKNKKNTLGLGFNHNPTAQGWSVRLPAIDLKCPDRWTLWV